MSATQSPINVVVTGAAGQIGYAALFRIAAGAMLGHFWNCPTRSVPPKAW